MIAAGGRKPRGRDRVQFSRRVVHRPAQRSPRVGDATDQQRRLCRVGHRAAVRLAMHGRKRAGLLRRIVPDRGGVGRLRAAADLAFRRRRPTRPCRAACSGAASAPFAAWVLLGSILTNLFGVVDRYMILHFSQMPADRGPRRGGQLLCRPRRSLVAGLDRHHARHDDHSAPEPRLGGGPARSGRRKAAAVPESVRLRVVRRCRGGARCSRRCCSTWDSTGSFPQGLAVLPWTLVCCTWFGLSLISQNYLLCAEKARLASVALACGLALNIPLNLLLLPRCGLEGAVLSAVRRQRRVAVVRLPVQPPPGFSSRQWRQAGARVADSAVSWSVAGDARDGRRRRLRRLGQSVALARREAATRRGHWRIRRTLRAETVVRRPRRSVTLCTANRRRRRQCVGNAVLPPRNRRHTFL